MTRARGQLDLTVATRPPIEAAPGGESFHDLVDHALLLEEAAGAWEIAIVVTDDAGIQDLHRQFMGLDSPTDILTFPYDDDDGFLAPTPRVAGGDVVISLDTARANAVDAHWPVEREMQFLVLHGVLHLLGWDDATPDGRAEMLARQQAILDDWLEHRSPAR